MENLRQVLHIIQENGIHLKFWKCVFMAGEAIYLGFKIKENGVPPVKGNIRNIRTTKEPQNISELTSLLNYF